MSLITLGTIALGVGCYVAGAFIPSAQLQLFSVASALVAWALPGPKDLVAKMKSGAPKDTP
jgi:hypothetical protein